MLTGKKTYLVAVALVVAAIVEFVNGDATLGDMVMKVLEGLGLAALRCGIAKDK